MELKEGVHIDIMRAQHLVVIALNDEGDFCVLPVVFRNCHPDHDFIDMLPHGGVILEPNKNKQDENT